MGPESKSANPGLLPTPTLKVHARARMPRGGGWVLISLCHNHSIPPVRLAHLATAQKTIRKPPCKPYTVEKHPAVAGILQLNAKNLCVSTISTYTVSPAWNRCRCSGKWATRKSDHEY